MDRKKQIAELAKSKRSSKRWSQTDLANSAKVSIATIGKFEKGEFIKDDSLGKILCALGMLDILSLYRSEQLVTGYKALSLEELRTCVSCCKDIIREGEHEDKASAIHYKLLAETEIKNRLDKLFK